ncbi:MAG: hypothetical protein WDW36_005341 [Sanguina aurantia]
MSRYQESNRNSGRSRYAGAACAQSQPGEQRSQTRWCYIRNLLVGPINEEFFFRASMAPLLRLQGLGIGACTLITPLFFGAAHLHHLWDLVKHQKLSLRAATQKVAFQFLYTTVFGLYATFLFLRTGHLVAPVAAHAFANLMGLPPFPAMAEHRYRSLLGLTTCAGVIGFGCLLMPMTSPGLFPGVGVDMFGSSNPGDAVGPLARDSDFAHDLTDFEGDATALELRSQDASRDSGDSFDSRDGDGGAKKTAPAPWSRSVDNPRVARLRGEARSTARDTTLVAKLIGEHTSWQPTLRSTEETTEAQASKLLQPPKRAATGAHAGVLLEL